MKTKKREWREQSLHFWLHGVADCWWRKCEDASGLFGDMVDELKFTLQ